MTGGEAVGVGLIVAAGTTGVGMTVGAAATTLRTGGGLRASRSAGICPAAASGLAIFGPGAFVTGPGASATAGFAADESPLSRAWIADAAPNATAARTSVARSVSWLGISPAGCCHQVRHLVHLLRGPNDATSSKMRRKHARDPTITVVLRPCNTALDRGAGFELDPNSHRFVPTQIAPRMTHGETRCANAIFQQPWWLDAVAPGRWAEVTCEHGGRIVARLPYVVRGGGGLRMLTQSSLTPTLGPWIEPSSAKPSRALAREHELLAELEAALPSARAFSQQFSPLILNALPFYWAGYRLEVRYTSRLQDLRSTDALWDGLRDNVRREIRKARKRVEVVDDLGVDQFHHVWSKTYARQRIRTPHSLDSLRRLEDACARRGAGAMLFARDDAGQVHAVAWVVWDPNGAYHLLAGADPRLRASGASSLLMWEAITRSRAVADVFDFHGSMLQPVERFFRAFGGRQTPYLSVTRIGPAVRLALTARSGWGQLAARWPPRRR